MNPRVAQIRLHICQKQCPHPCAAFLAGAIDHGNPEAVCPVVWKTQWGAVSGSSVPVDRPESRHESWRPATWEDLHVRALNHDGSDDNAWLAGFVGRVPNINCSCRADALRWIRANPPPFARYFEWTVAFHNGVNTRLNKPCMTLEAALQRWDKPA